SLDEGPGQGARATAARKLHRSNVTTGSPRDQKNRVVDEAPRELDELVAFEKVALPSVCVGHPGRLGNLDRRLSIRALDHQGRPLGQGWVTRLPKRLLECLLFDPGWKDQTTGNLESSLSNFRKHPDDANASPRTRCDLRGVVDEVGDEFANRKVADLDRELVAPRRVDFVEHANGLVCASNPTLQVP